MIDAPLMAFVAVSAAYRAVCAQAPFPVVLPDAAPLPALSYQLISTKDEYTLDGALGFTQTRLQVDAWATTFAAARSLAAAVKVALEPYVGLLADGSTVFNIQCDGSQSSFEPESRIYRIQTDYLVWSG